MTFEEYIEKKFEQNLELAREEIELHDNSDDIETRAWRFATDWTQEEVAADIARYFGRKWAEQQEYLNKAFYE